MKENSLVVANAHHSVAIRAMAHEDFPTLPKVSADDPQNLFSIEPADFVRGHLLIQEYQSDPLE